MSINDSTEPDRSMIETLTLRDPLTDAADVPERTYLPWPGHPPTPLLRRTVPWPGPPPNPLRAETCPGQDLPRIPLSAETCPGPDLPRNPLAPTRPQPRTPPESPDRVSPRLTSTQALPS